MTEQQNISKLVLDHVISRSADGEQANLIELADETGVKQNRLCDRVNTLYPAIESGVSPRFPWVCDKSEALGWYDAWDADPPACLDDADWTLDEHGDYIDD